LRRAVEYKIGGEANKIPGKFTAKGRSGGHKSPVIGVLVKSSPKGCQRKVRRIPQEKGHLIEGVKEGKGEV